MHPGLVDALSDLTKFAPAFLRIKAKSAESLPFKLNSAQAYIHTRLQEQLATTGRVRAVILKGRQQGCSTYIQARFFHKSIHPHARSRSN
jgi:hypothetical protein